MAWIQTKILFEAKNNELAIELISDLFFSFGLKNLRIDDPTLEPEEGWGKKSKNPPEGYAIVGYFPEARYTEIIAGELRKRLEALESELGIHGTLQSKRLHEEDWAESWKDFYKPYKVSGRITVKPTWRKYYPGPDEVILEIDPGMAFGAGTHPTTAMCIRLIEQYFKKAFTFLDIGTGSGILMVLAAKLGASKMLGIDNDEAVLDIAENNLRMNHVSRKRFALKTGNLAEQINDTFDMVAANIQSKAIIALLDQIEDVLSDSGALICSGILKNETGNVLSKISQQGLRVLEECFEGDWAAIACCKTRHLCSYPGS